MINVAAVKYALVCANKQLLFLFFGLYLHPSPNTPT